MSKRIILLQALASTPNDLALTVKGMAEDVVWQRPSPDEWSVGDVMAHLGYVEQHYLQRLQRVVAEERPFLPAIWPDESKHNHQTGLEELNGRFAAARTHTLAYLKELSPGGWQRKAVHETRGDVTLRFLVQFLVEHDIAHLNQIIEIQQQLRALPKRNVQPAID